MILGIFPIICIFSFQVIYLQNNIWISGNNISKRKSGKGNSGVVIPKRKSGKGKSGVIIPKRKSDERKSGVVIPKRNSDEGKYGVVIPKRKSGVVFSEIHCQLEPQHYLSPYFKTIEKDYRTYFVLIKKGKSFVLTHPLIFYNGLTRCFTILTIYINFVLIIFCARSR